MLGLLLGAYALTGLYSYQEMDTSQPPEGLEERVVAISIMPMQSEQEKRLSEERRRKKLGLDDPALLRGEREREKVYV